MLNEILGGLAGGLSGVAGGMETIQQQRQKQAQLQLQQEAAKRQAVQDAQDQLYRSYQTVGEGDAIDPVMAAQYKAAGIGGMEAAGDKIIKSKSPQQQLLEMKLDEAGLEAADRTKKRSVLDQIHNDGAGFFTKPLIERLSITRAAGVDDDLAMLPEEKTKFSPQVAAANISAGPRYASAAVAGQVTPAVRARLDQQIYDTAVRAATAKSKDVMGNVDPVKYEANLSAELARAKQGVSGVPQAQVAPPTGKALAPGTRGKVQGIPAVWDGKQWVEE